MTMSTLTNKCAMATIRDPERAAPFLKVLGTATVAILPEAEIAMRPDRPAPAIFYKLDLAAYTSSQIDGLIREIAAKWGLTEREVATDIGIYGIPILADQVTVGMVDVDDSKA